jgi:hypothetical protein
MAVKMLMQKLIRITTPDHLHKRSQRRPGDRINPA